jgi:hypothetical protein
MVIQGASKLINLIKEQGNNREDEAGDELLTLESLKAEIERLEARLAATDDSNIEQIKLIEQLAQQNEVLAESMSKGFNRFNLITIVAAIACFVSLIALVIVLIR